MGFRKSFAAAILAVTLASSLVFADGFSQPPAGWAGQRTSTSTSVGPGDRDLRVQLASLRARNIARLHTYMMKGVFPHNTVSNGLLNMFQDPQTGVLCAVASLIAQSGRQDLVDQQIRDNNFVRLGEVTTGPVYEWILGSGFTQEEIALIQLPDSPIMRGGYPEYPGERPELPGKIYPTIEQANQMVKDHIKMVERRLRLDTPRSLNLVVARAKAYAAAKLVPPPVPPIAPPIAVVVPPPVVIPQPPIRPFPHPVG